MTKDYETITRIDDYLRKKNKRTLGKKKPDSDKLEVDTPQTEEKTARELSEEDIEKMLEASSSIVRLPSRIFQVIDESGDLRFVRLDRSQRIRIPEVVGKFGHPIVAKVQMGNALKFLIVSPSLDATDMKTVLINMMLGKREKDAITFVINPEKVKLNAQSQETIGIGSTLQLERRLPRAGVLGNVGLNMQETVDCTIRAIAILDKPGTDRHDSKNIFTIFS